MKGLIQKIVCFSAAAVLMVSSAACQKNAEPAKTDTKTSEASNYFNATGLPIAKQPITLRAMVKHANMSKKNFSEKELFQKWSKETNVNIDWIEISGTNQVWDEKVSLAINSGDTPDMIYAGNIQENDLPTAVAEGFLLPLDDLIAKYAPNEQKLLKEYPHLKSQAIYLSDGKQYLYMGLSEKSEAIVRAPLFINKVWMDKLNLKMPTTVDEYYQVLKAFKEKDPNGNGKVDEIPFSTDKDSPISPLFSSWGISESKTQDKLITINNGKVSFNYTNSKLFEALQYLNKLYSEGLIDAEFMTQDSNQFKGKGKANPVLFGSLIEYAPDNTVGTKNAEGFQVIPPLKGPDGTQKWPVNANALSGSTNFMIFKSCKYPEAAIRWIDYLNDGLNAIIHKRGPEGLTWAKDDATKTYWSFEVEMAAKGQNMQEIAYTEASWNGPTMDLQAIHGYKFVDKDPNSQGNRKKGWTEVYKPYLFAEYWPNMGIRKTTDIDKDMALVFADLQKYTKTFLAESIMKGIDKQKWDAHITKCKALKADEYVKYMQAIYDEYLKTVKK